MDKTALLVVIGAGAVILLGVLGMLAMTFRRVPANSALIIHKLGAEPRVSFSGGAVVLPVVNRFEVLDMSVKTLKVKTSNVRCADDARVDIDVTCYVRVIPTVDDVIKVARSVGCERMSQPSTLEELFVPKFGDAIVTVASKLGLSELRSNRDVFKDTVIEVIGRDLNGFALDDVAIDRIEPASPVAHDPDARARVDRSDDVGQLRRDVAALEQRLARLVEQLTAAKLIDGDRV